MIPPLARALQLAFATLASLFVLALAPGPVPDEALVAKAQAEGVVDFYGAMSAGDAAKLFSRFEAQYHVHVESLLVRAEQVPGRIMTEQRAGRPNADVVLLHGYQTDQLKRAGYLVEYRLPENRDYLPGTYDPDGYWTAAQLGTDVLAYNPKRLRAAGLSPPKSWSDLTRPEWKGQLALYKASYEWYAAMKRSLGAEETDRLMRGFVANGVQIVASHELALTLTAAGEYGAAIGVYGYDAARLQRLGQSVAFVNAKPTIAEINAIALVKNGPHPDAARLFARWITSRETQQFIVTTFGRISGRKDVRNDPAIWGGSVPIAISNPADSAGYADTVNAYDNILGIHE